MQTYGNNAAILVDHYNPDYIVQSSTKEAACYFGDYPTLSQLEVKFGNGYPSAWIMMHLHDLSEFCGCKEKLSGHALQQCAMVIASEFYFLKISELMLFFHRFKSGRYGRFYGSVDPLVITTALHEFLSERAFAYDRHEQELRLARDEAGRKNAVTWEEHCIKVYGEVRPHPITRVAGNQETKTLRP